MTAYLLDDLSVFLSSQGLGGATSSASWMITKAYMPPQPNNVIGLFETGGEAPDRYQANLDYPRFQVRCRGTAFAYSSARAKLFAVFQALQGVDNGRTINGRYYPGIEAVSDAIGFPLDSNNRPEVLQNFRAFRSRTT